MNDRASEIGRELKVSELSPRTVVWLTKEGSGWIATMWVVDINACLVCFYAGVTGINFLAKRSGSDLEEITDDSGVPMKLYEFLGKV